MVGRASAPASCLFGSTGILPVPGRAGSPSYRAYIRGWGRVFGKRGRVCDPGSTGFQPVGSHSRSFNLNLFSRRSADTGNQSPFYGASLPGPRRRIFHRPPGWWAADLPRWAGLFAARANSGPNGARNRGHIPLTCREYNKTLHPEKPVGIHDPNYCYLMKPLSLLDLRAA